MKLVFLHGWAYTPAVWHALRAELGEYESFAPALQAPQKPLEDWAASLAPSIPEGAVLVGWSLGAMLALSLAAAFPGTVRGLYLMGASPKFLAAPDWDAGLNPMVFNTFKTGFQHTPGKTLKRFLALQVMGDARRTELTQALEPTLAKPATDASLQAGLAALEHTDLRRLQWPQGLPVRLLHGQQDALMPVSAAQWLAEQIPGSRLDILPDAGHAPLFSQPHSLAQRVREFIREC